MRPELDPTERAAIEALKARSKGDARTLKLCEVALDTWYFTPLTREWALARVREILRGEG